MILITFACSSTYYFINSVEYQDTITRCVNWSWWDHCFDQMFESRPIIQEKLHRVVAWSSAHL